MLKKYCSDIFYLGDGSTAPSYRTTFCGNSVQGLFKRYVQLVQGFLFVEKGGNLKICDANFIKNRGVVAEGNLSSWFSVETSLRLSELCDLCNTAKNRLKMLIFGCKTNEITAAPKLLNSLNLEGVVVTVDALMRQFWWTVLHSFRVHVFLLCGGTE